MDQEDMVIEQILLLKKAGSTARNILFGDIDYNSLLCGSPAFDII